MNTLNFNLAAGKLLAESFAKEELALCVGIGIDSEGRQKVISHDMVLRIDLPLLLREMADHVESELKKEN